MQSTTLLGRSAIVLALLGAAAGAQAIRPLPAAAGANPCAMIDFDPGPPPPRGEPTAAGFVRDAASGSGIAGATVRLHQCVSGADSVVAINTTGPDGGYIFTALPSGLYYVEAVMIGPLANRVSTSVPANSTGAVWLEDDVLNLDLSFRGR